MKAVILTCFESNEERVSFVYDACISRGYDTRAYTSDFSHIRKEKRDHIPDCFIAVKTRPYKRNLSLGRILSHRQFARDAFALLEKDVPDLIWLMAPANSLIREAEKYKKNHPEVKLIIDIIDMWPESLPFSLNKDMFPLNLWKRVRKDHIRCCDALVSECDMYQQILKDEYPGKITSIYWSRDHEASIRKKVLSDDPLVLCYIGSINNIIDVDRMADAIRKIDRKVVLHVIGEGENCEYLIRKMKEVCELVYHGPIRDEQKKAEIFDLCHAGINVYKEGLYIGLTVKCIDYFEHGLPIINNIKGDTWRLVEEYHAGVNLDETNRVDENMLINQRNDNWNIYQLFEENFSKQIFTEKCLKVIDEVLK